MHTQCRLHSNWRSNRRPCYRHRTRVVTICHAIRGAILGMTANLQRHASDHICCLSAAKESLQPSRFLRRGMLQLVLAKAGADRRP